MIDQVIIEARAGAGGKGAVSFRREKFEPKGGPDGGQGGRGGHVVALANGQLNTLARFRRQQILRAGKGQPGDTANRRGRDGEDLILEMPIGTIITRLKADGSDGGVIADLAEDGTGAVVARGGRGGHGNTFFKSSMNRAPRVAQQGQAGEAAKFRLELRLIADVGIVGLPNAGKSTLLAQLTAARPRVAAYPFTTLEPHIGVVYVGWHEIVVADLPGLIEGASEGAGLGHEFLRHTSRTRLLIHLVDGTAADPVANYQLINRELARYSPELAEKAQLLLVNKLDTDDVQLLQDDITSAFAVIGETPLFISALTGESTEEVGSRAAAAVEEARQAAASQRRESRASDIVLTPRPDSRRFQVRRLKEGSFRVEGTQVETFVEMMDTEDDSALEEVYRWLERRGVAGALRKAGLEPGARVRIGRAGWVWES